MYLGSIQNEKQSEREEVGKDKDEDLHVLHEMDPVYHLKRRQEAHPERLRNQEDQQPVMFSGQVRCIRSGVR